LLNYGKDSSLRDKRSVGEELSTNTDDKKFQLAMMLIWGVHTKV
jgi:hypothetical protein